MSDTPAPDANDDITDEELAAALALIKKRRADAARQQEQTQQATVPVLGTSYPPAVAKPLATPSLGRKGVKNTLLPPFPLPLPCEAR